MVSGGLLMRDEPAERLLLALDDADAADAAVPKLAGVPEYGLVYQALRCGK